MAALAALAAEQEAETAQQPAQEGKAAERDLRTVGAALA
jgi:hypothetical protein